MVIFKISRNLELPFLSFCLFLLLTLGFIICIFFIFWFIILYFFF